jgi:hypothetical protein
MIEREATVAGEMETDGFDFPCGWPDGEGYYIAAGLAEEAYYRRFGAWHTGEDWNGIRGGDSDLGDRVHAVANGVVAASDYFPPSWGNVVLIRHKMPNGDQVWSQYAHLRERRVVEGDEVARGDQIGTIGKGHNNRYPAHLHFEIRRRELAPNAWGLSRGQVFTWYAHPTEFIKAHRPGLGVEITLEEDDDACIRSVSRYWHPAPIGHGGGSLWTYTMRSKEDCWAEWRPTLPRTGLYEVMAFIPSANATSQQAGYEITHRRGSDVVVIDQSRYFDQWVSLGQYPFSLAASMPSVVRLSDMTGEPFTRDIASRKQIAFDAIRFVLVEKV